MDEAFDRRLSAIVAGPAVDEALDRWLSSIEAGPAADEAFDRRLSETAAGPAVVDDDDACDMRLWAPLTDPAVAAVDIVGPAGALSAMSALPWDGRIPVGSAVSAAFAA